MSFLEKLLRRKHAKLLRKHAHCQAMSPCRQTDEAMLRTICSGEATEEEIKASVKAHFRAIDEHTRKAA